MWQLFFSSGSFFVIFIATFTRACVNPKMIYLLNFEKLLDLAKVVMLQKQDYIHAYVNNMRKCMISH